MQGYYQQRKLTLVERLDNIERQQSNILNSIESMRRENIISHTLMLGLIQELINQGKFILPSLDEVPKPP